jgi:ParB family chromosome partitioning protein
MHPADQMIAFKALVDEGQTAGQIAAAFGVSVLTVERRLKLASLAPMFLDMYREGTIELSVLQALAMAGDAAQQVKVWESLPSYGRSGYHIRQMLTEGEVATDTAVAVFVGVEAYREAGGPVRDDLFSPEGEAYLQDGALLHRLALDKLVAEAQKLREAGWKWAEARMNFPYSERSRFAQLRCEAVTPTQKEQAAIDALQADLDRIRARMNELEALEGYDEDSKEERAWTPEQQAEYDALDLQWSDLNSQLEAMHEALREWTPQQKAVAGVVLSIDNAGRVYAVEGLVRPEDRKTVAEALGHEGGNDAALGGAGSHAGVSSFESAPKARSEFSASLCQSLTAHRTAAVAAALTQCPQVALAALLHTLIVNEREQWQTSPLDVKFASNASDVGRAASEYDQTPAAHTLEQADAFGDRVPGDSAHLFDHLQKMELDGLLELLARFVGRAYSVQASNPVRTQRYGFDPARGIEQALGMDLADWWAATPERYLNHVSKAKMVEAVTEACGAEAARPIEKMKKGEAVSAAAALLEGKRWLPSTLRPYPTPMTGDAGAVDNEEESED